MRPHLQNCSYFYDSVRLLLKIFKVLGFLPLKETSAELGYFEHSYKYFFFFFPYIIAGFILSILYPPYFDKKKHNVITSNTMAYHLYIFISLTALHIASLSQYKNIKNIFINIETFDRNLLKYFSTLNLTHFFESRFHKYINISISFIFPKSLLIYVMSNLSGIVRVVS